MSYPTLTLLLQGYLNIDWPDDYRDPMEAVDDFVAQEPNAPALISEIDSLLRAAGSEEQLRLVVMDELGSGYVPEADGWKLSTWLEAVRDRARAKLQR